MERLTTKTEYGNVLTCCVGCEAVNDCSSPCDEYFIAIDKFSEYENSLLNPEEIKELVLDTCKGNHQKWNKKLSQLLHENYEQEK